MILSLFALVLLPSKSRAQQNLWMGEGVRSVEVSDANCVTFRLYAPDAESVALRGDFLKEDVAMSRGEDGV